MTEVSQFLCERLTTQFCLNNIVLINMLGTFCKQIFFFRKIAFHSVSWVNDCGEVIWKAVCCSMTSTHFDWFFFYFVISCARFVWWTLLLNRMCLISNNVNEPEYSKKYVYSSLSFFFRPVKGNRRAYFIHDARFAHTNCFLKQYFFNLVLFIKF